MLSPTYQFALVQGKAYRILRANVSRTLEQFDLSMPEWTLLGVLSEKSALRLVDVATILDVDAPLVTTLVKQLKCKQLLTLSSDPSDNRAKLLQITDMARELIARLEGLVAKNLAPLVQSVSSEDLQTYFRVLEAVL